MAGIGGPGASGPLRRGHLRLGRHDHAVAHRRPRPSSGGLRAGSTTTTRPSGLADDSPPGSGRRRTAPGTGPAAGQGAPTSRTSSPRPGLVAGDPRAVAGLAAYQAFWEPHTWTDPQIRPSGKGCVTTGSGSGCCPTRIWPPGLPPQPVRARRRARPVDADVYSSEIAWAKPQRRDLPRGRRRGRRRAGASACTSATAVTRTCTAAVGRGCARSWCRTATSPPASRWRTTRRPTPWPTSCSTSSTSARWLDGRLTRHARRHGGPDTAHRRLHRGGGARGRLGRRGRRGRWAGPAAGAAPRVPDASPAQILATNKFGSIFGTTTSAVTYYRRVHPDLRTALPMAGSPSWGRSSAP